MAGVSSTSGAKRKMAAQESDHPPEPLKITLLSSALLLEIPAETNTSLPVWEAMRSQHVDVTWTVRPYSISVHFTPAVPKQGTSAVKSKTGVLGQSSTFSPIASQQHGRCQSAPCVLLTFPQGTQLMMPNPPAHPQADSITVSLPLIFTQPQTTQQPTQQPGWVPVSIPTPTTAPTKMHDSSKPPVLSTFHTKYSSEVKICDNFLLNTCSEGGKCRKHHTPYPFHWQLWCPTNHQWVDVSPRAQILLERTYCNVSHDVIFLKDGNCCFTLSCDSMELDDSLKYDAIRRLENSSDESDNRYFPSKWKIYWWGNTSWVEYHKSVSTLLLEKVRKKDTSCFFNIGSEQYKLDIIRMIQTNVHTGFERRVRCRPMYRSPESMQPHLQTGITDPTEAPLDPSRANFSVDPLEEFSSWYPPVWHLPSDEDFSLVDVPAGTVAYRRVQDLFYESMPETSVDIISIQQIQNLLHWDRYQRQKVHMQKQDPKEPLERHLFHGTGKEASEDICHNNFDARMAGLHGTSCGSGSYFSTTSSYSNTFSNQLGKDEVCHMFLAKVLVGKVCIGGHDMHRPPPVHYRKQYLLYDACVDNMDKPTMFVVFDSCQCYPYYLIKYKALCLEIDI
ncbi:protein mono-ADP-ribosyltransferase TIPARP-like [Betta splendens]|uniref:Protein mono-ADP-ribosyltransferase TIPARP-like n=1 Tax=Betta splendens TaxID=158456 RepID=A0A6P7NIE7_BETSP|nr:protein mono-ADP-ribosyltransferase TIPARP-like [Betta splendens]XP_055368063.1 protein mono-ADP-ribosyltransferase TIPARP-like [Betta splendens]